MPAQMADSRPDDATAGFSAAQAGGQSVGDAVEQRRIEPGPGRERDADAVEDAGPRRSLLDAKRWITHTISMADPAMHKNSSMPS